MPRLPIVLASPPVRLSTAEVFAALPELDRPGLPPLPPAFAGPVDLASLADGSTRNDLAAPAGAVCRDARAAEASARPRSGVPVRQDVGLGRGSFRHLPVGGGGQARRRAP